MSKASESQNSSAAFVERLAAVECPDATYLEADPALVFDRASGSTIWDAAGKPYVDLCAGFGVMALGHHPNEHRAIFRTLADEARPPIAHGMGDVYAATDKVRLLEAIRAILPSGLTYGALALSGSQAVEIAVKSAMQWTKKSGFVVFQGGYHGVDLGILALTSRADFREPFSAWLREESVRRLPYGADAASIRAAFRSLDQAGCGVAGLLVEPIQGRAGMREPPPAWLAMLRQETQAAGVPLIYDEVFTGCGRTGTWTVADAAITPDLICLGKALGGGLPLSACFGHQELMAAWPRNHGEAIHTGTFFGHPLACRLALATLTAMRERQLLARVARLGTRIKEFMEAEAKGRVKVNGRGLFLALDFASPGAGAAMMDRLRAQGVIALASGEQGEGLSLTPAYTIGEDELLGALEKIVACLP